MGGTELEGGKREFVEAVDTVVGEFKLGISVVPVSKISDCLIKVVRAGSSLLIETCSGEVVGRVGGREAELLVVEETIGLVGGLSF